jgi:uncharacterized membrane protein
MQLPELINGENNMIEKTPTKNNSNMHAILLIIIGIILLIAGVVIISVPGAPMRGSGIGTVSVLAGVLLLFIALLRFRAKRA